MIIEERNSEKNLLKQCWLLLQWNIDQKQTKIQGSIIFLNNKIIWERVTGPISPLWQP